MVITDNQKRMIHALCRQCGLSEDKRRQMLHDNFGVDSTIGLNRVQASELIKRLKERLMPSEQKGELDKWRKRLIASIGAMLRMLNKEKPTREENVQYIKNIACRAGGYKHFNAIPKGRLTSLYNAFNNSQEDLKGAKVTVDDFINELSLMN